MSSVKVVLFPFFEECAKYTLDPYWRDLLISCSTNHFPPGLKYDSTRKVLTVRTRGKTENFPITEDRIETFQTMMTIFRKSLKLVSPRELQIQQEELDQARSKRNLDMNCDWKKIRPRQVKDRVLLDYVATLRTKYHLDTIEVRQLTSILQIGLQFRAITPDNIDYHDGAIHRIKGLKFDRETRTFSIPKAPLGGTKNDKASSVHKFYSSLDRFLKESNTRCTSY